MAETFTKLSSTLTESSVWTMESAETRIVWITMLAMADAGGVVHGSIPGLAQRAVVSIEACEEALLRLSSPDKYSRTPDNEGRRVEAIEGGWRLLNHGLYRARRQLEERREADRERKRRERSGSAPVHECPGHGPRASEPVRARPQCPPLSAHAEAEAEAEAEANTTTSDSAPLALVPTEPTPSPQAARRDAVRALWDWFEAQRVQRYRGKAKGLSAKSRRGVDATLKHIRETLGTDHAGALKSQRGHLEYRLDAAEHDQQTRSRLGKPTPWGVAWWDWWLAHVDEGEGPPPAPGSTQEPPNKRPARDLRPGELEVGPNGEIAEPIARLHFGKWQLAKSSVRAWVQCYAADAERCRVVLLPDGVSREAAGLAVAGGVR